VTLELSVNGQKIFSKRFYGLVQQYSDWSVPFSLGSLGNRIEVGDTVSFTLSSPSTSVGFAALTGVLPGYQMGALSGYGSANSRFYLGTNFINFILKPLSFFIKNNLLLLFFFFLRRR
jgi:hypothetical protein